MAGRPGRMRWFRDLCIRSPTPGLFSHGPGTGKKRSSPPAAPMTGAARNRRARRRPKFGVWTWKLLRQRLSSATTLRSLGKSTVTGGLQMRYLRFKEILAVWAFLGSISCVTLQAQTQSQAQPKPKPRAQAQAQPKSQTPRFSGVGSEATQEDIGNLAWVAGPSGKTLPPGSGTAKQGEAIFAARCAMCHGVDTHGVHWEPMAFSPIAGPPLSLPPQKSTGPHNPWIPPLTSGAPFPEVIFNTIAVEMPMFRPGTLTADQVYALSAFIF